MSLIRNLKNIISDLMPLTWNRITLRCNVRCRNSVCHLRCHVITCAVGSDDIAVCCDGHHGTGIKSSHTLVLMASIVLQPLSQVFTILGSFRPAVISLKHILISNLLKDKKNTEKKQTTKTPHYNSIWITSYR